MANIKISELPLFSGTPKSLYFIVNNSGNTETYRANSDELLRDYYPYLLTGNTEFTFSGMTNVVSINTLSATTINLHPTPTPSKLFIVKVKHDATIFPVSILGNGNTIDGSSGVTVNIQNTSILFLYDGEEYIII